jgi:hypothetical protein
MDLTGLEKMNREMPLRENEGDGDYFEKRLAPHMAMRRRGGGVVGRETYVGDLKKGGDRETLSIDSMTMLGKERALVVCRVKADGKVSQNVRLFIRDAQAPEGWLLLAWANEPDETDV